MIIMTQIVALLAIVAGGLIVGILARDKDAHRNRRRLLLIIILLFQVSLSKAFAAGNHCLVNDSIVSDSVITDQIADSIIAAYKAENSRRDSLVAFPGDYVNTYQHPYYDWRRDVSFVGVPIFISSFVIKGSKTGFRSARYSFQKNFKSEIDNYTQYSPYAVVIGCKLAGYQGRSNWGRFLASTAFSNIAMATFVNTIKYSVKEMRPDNSTANSFPSGHTATAFTAATVLHKEYGLTRSPWFSIGGYAVATATGVMRVLNNRHWVSDVVAGAGIGIMSTELGYFAADLIFRDKGIKRYELDSDVNSDHPSFFDIQMGVGLHAGSLNFTFGNSVPDQNVKLGTSTVFGVEGAHFINKYLGFGFIGRVTSTPANGLDFSDEEKANIRKVNTILSKYQDMNGNPLPGIYSITLDNSNFNNASLDAGVYFNLPIGKRFAAGAKVLAGCRFGNGICYKASNGNPKIDDTYSIIDRDGNSYPVYWFEDADGDQFRSTTLLDPTVVNDYNYVLNNRTEEYDIIKVDGKSAFNYVLGLSFKYRYKSCFAWKVFVDFDSSKNKYTYTAKYLSDEALNRISTSGFVLSNQDLWKKLNNTVYGYSNKTLNLFTIGAAFTVNL